MASFFDWLFKSDDDSQQDSSPGDDADKKDSDKAAADKPDDGNWYDGLTKFLKAFEKVWDDIKKGQWLQAFNDTMDYFTSDSDAAAAKKKEAGYAGEASNYQPPGVFNRVKNWVANRAAPAESVSVVYDVATKNGLTAEDAGALATIVQGESAWDRYARNPKSSAGGWWQMLDTTARALGVKDKFDPTESTEGAVRLYKDIRQGIADAVYGGDVTKVSHGQIKLGWAYGANGAIHLLQGDPNASAVEALRAAGMSGDVASAMGGNLTDAEKKANPNWANMTKGQLVSVIVDRFDDTEKAVVSNNAAALHLSPGSPAAPLLAEANPPQPVGPQPSQGRGNYRGMNIPVVQEEVPDSQHKTGRVQTIDTGRKKGVPEVDLPAAG